MPRFHFGIHENGRLITDEDGQNFANVDVARKKAALTGPALQPKPSPFEMMIAAVWCANQQNS